MLPFTVDQFFAVFADYNKTIWPAPVIAYVVGGAVVAAAWAAVLPRLVFAALAAMWAWTGIAYHVLFFAPINPAAYAFGALFVVQAGILLLPNSAAKADATTPHRSAVSFVAIGLIAYAMVLYPAFGWLAGHHYPAVPSFGITPCPLTIFTFGVLMLIGAGARWLPAIIPMLWSIIGGTAALMLAVPQDAMLPVAAVVFVAVGRAERRRALTSRPNTRHPPESPYR